MSSLRESNPRLYFFQENIIYKIIFLTILYSSKEFTERRHTNKYLNIATAKNEVVWLHFFEKWILIAATSKFMSISKIYRLIEFYQIILFY